MWSSPVLRLLYRFVGWLRQLSMRLARRLVPAPVALYELVTGVWLTEMIYALTALGIADRLAEAPRRADELAAATGADADALMRLLRALATVGLLRRARDGRYRLTRLSSVLRSDAPQSMRDLVLYGGSRPSVEAWSHFLDVVRTGRDGYELAHGRSLFDHLAHHPDEAATFSGAMVCLTRLETPALARGFDYGSLGSICDVGGGRGWLLAAILARHPRLRGVLFDDARALADAGPVLDRFGVAARCTTVAGSFFDDVPAGCDAYVLKEILHDWDDARADRILATVRRAAARGARLLVIEMLLVDDDRPHPVKLLDLQMMTATHGGRQRTRAELAALLASTGFELERVIELATPSNIVVARAV